MLLSPSPPLLLLGRSAVFVHGFYKTVCVLAAVGNRAGEKVGESDDGEGDEESAGEEGGRGAAAGVEGWGHGCDYGSG